MLVLLWWFYLEPLIHFSPHQGPPCYNCMLYWRVSKPVIMLGFSKFFFRSIHWASLARSCLNISLIWFLSRWKFAKSNKFEFIHLKRLSRFILMHGCHQCCYSPPCLLHSTSVHTWCRLPSANTSTWKLSQREQGKPEVPGSWHLWE